MATRGPFATVLRRNVRTIAVLTTLAAIALFVGAGILVRVLLGGGRFDAEDVATTSALVAAFALSVPFDSLSYPLSRGLTRRTTRSARSPRRSPDSGSSIARLDAPAPAAGILAIPFGYAVGMAVKVALLAMFLRPRVDGEGSGAGGQAPPASSGPP